jgi:hypothetical protein
MRLDRDLQLAPYQISVRHAELDRRGGTRVSEASEDAGASIKAHRD